MIGLGAMVPGPLRPAAKRVRAFVRGLRPVAHDRPLAADCRAAVRAERAVGLAEAGRPFGVNLRITNHSPHVISPVGPHPVGVAAFWQSYAGEPCDWVDGFAPLSRPLWPGEELSHEFRFTAPDSLGDYAATFTLAQRGGPAFEPVGSAAKLDIPVTDPFDTGFNYHDIYSAADLERDFWSASGPPSEAEFHRLVPIKLKLLTDLGLTPHSRLLDVGCGTGLLATAAESFLTADGRYVGTDLAPEAVEFCRRRFTRPNFHFAVNGMTTLPEVGGPFDAVAFYSVFTHTYPDETTLLLAEVKRVLAPGGFVFADVFTSPLVQRHAGSRFAVEVNRDLLLRLIGLAGLKAEVMMTSAWKGKATREFFKLTHRQ